MAKRDVAPPEKGERPPSPARVAAFRSGLSAETRAAAYLMVKGYRILARRFRTPHGEIDLVAQRRQLVAFIEVKARASLEEAAYAVTPRQQRRIIDAAQGCGESDAGFAPDFNERPIEGGKQKDGAAPLLEALFDLGEVVEVVVHG